MRSQFPKMTNCLPSDEGYGSTYGAQAGLAYASWQINKLLQQRSPQLDKIYTSITHDPWSRWCYGHAASNLRSENLFEVTDEMVNTTRSRPSV